MNQLLCADGPRNGSEGLPMDNWVRFISVHTSTKSQWKILKLKGQWWALVHGWALVSYEI